MPATYRQARGEALVRVENGRHSHWALDPYSGCELACTFCQARDLAPFADADVRVFERDILVRSNAVETVARAARTGAFHRLPLVLGKNSDPWQPAEERFKLTRAILEALAPELGIDLRAQTRSSLVTRDADLLAAIARQGRVSVSFSIPTQDRRLAKLLEPLSPTPDRRFVALETLARAGVCVGVIVAPVMPGLNDSDLALDGLLRRARDAGATFAAAASLTMALDARAKLVRFVSSFDPELATRYDRILARTGESEHGFSIVLERRFAELCTRHGLVDAWAQHRGHCARPPRAAGPRQLDLFHMP